MNELHKYATFAVDLVGTPTKVNNLFSIGRARIFYKGRNRNRSIIEGTAAEHLASTISGTPIIGRYNYDTKDFEGHGENQCAFGFVPLDPHSTWESVVDNNGISHEYLVVDVVIWDGRFEEAENILTDEKSLSMELNAETMKGCFEKIEDTTYYKITYAEFAGITILGDDVEPCFEDAKFITAYSKMVNAYALYVESMRENSEGGKNIMENNETIVEPEVTAEEAVETVETEEVVEEAATEEVAEAEAEVVEETAEEAETEETSDTDFACGDDKTKSSKDGDDNDDEDDEDVCPECGKNPCVCKSELNEEEQAEGSVEEEVEENAEENTVSQEAYSAIVAELASYKTKYESIEQKYNEALNSLNKYTKKEKLEIISKFSTKLESDELIEKLTNEVDNYSIEDIKSELGSALVDQIAAEDNEAKDEETDSNFSLSINLNSNDLGNSAWDLVKRYKENR